MQKLGLGKGLSALIPNKVEETEDKAPVSQSGKQIMREIAISAIKPNPNQPRQRIEEDKLLELADSIKLYGLLQPLVIDQNNTLIAGQRRLEAAKLAGLERVPAVIRESDMKQSLEMSLIENVQRENLNPVEQALGYKALVDKFGLSHVEVAERVGKKRPTISNYLRLLKLPLTIQKGLREGMLSEDQAKALLEVRNQEKQMVFYRRIIKEGLNGADARILLRKYRKRRPRKRKPREPILVEAEEKLEGFLDTRVKVTRDGRIGKIYIEFYSPEELEGLLEKVIKK